MMTIRYLFLVTLAVTLCMQSNASANCDPCEDVAELRPSLWPPPGEIPTNALFLLEQSNSLRVPPLSMLEVRRPRLVLGDGSEILMVVVELHDGQCSQSQALLAPAEPLTPGDTVRFVYDNTDGILTTPLAFDNLGSPEVMPEWTVGPGPDLASPITTGTPVQTGTDIVPMGCGPAEYVSLDAPVEDDSLVLGHITSTTQDDEPWDYLIPINPSGEIELGHGMCHGPFTFDGMDDFDLILDWVDIAGNSTPGGRVTISAPSLVP